MAATTSKYSMHKLPTRFAIVGSFGSRKDGQTSVGCVWWNLSTHCAKRTVIPLWGNVFQYDKTCRILTSVAWEQTVGLLAYTTFVSKRLVTTDSLCFWATVSALVCLVCSSTFVRIIYDMIWIEQHHSHESHQHDTEVLKQEVYTLYNTSIW